MSVSGKGKIDIARILGDVVYNQSSLSAWNHRHAEGDEDARATLVPIAMYSSKLLGREDQLLLAVNNISFQEIKDSQAPVSGWEKEPGQLMHGWRGTSFRAMFSLNDGDAKALRKILESTGLASDREKRLCFQLGERDEQGDLRIPEPVDGAPAPYMAMDMPRGTGTGMTLRFAYYDGDAAFGEYPCVIAEVMLDANRSGHAVAGYTPAMVWRYGVILNSPNGRIPSDSISRQRYDATKMLMRSLLSALGVTPSGLRS